MSTMPGLIGLSMASKVICDLAQKPFESHEMDDVKYTAYQRLHFFGIIIKIDL